MNITQLQLNLLDDFLDFLKNVTNPYDFVARLSGLLFADVFLLDLTICQGPSCRPFNPSTKIITECHS